MSREFPRRDALIGAAAIALAPASLRAQSGTWPSQPIRLVVPFAPGGTTDLTARLVASGLQERLGASIVIENKPGAGATVGSEQVARSAPDGYTLVMSNIASHAISPAVYRKIRYDAVRDFAHVALVISNPSVWVANKDSGIRTLADVVREARSRAGGLDMATSGSGSSNHLLLVRGAQVMGVTLNHIPFRGAGPAMTAVIAGQVPMMSDSLPSAAAHIRQGAVVPVAMSSVERHPSFPDVPTFREQGHDLISSSWFGLSAPAGTPQPIVDRLNREVRAVIATPEMRARFAELGGTPGEMSAEEYTRFVADEVARWAPVVQAAGATAD